ncbi:N-acetylmuramoyl-L-alanine amidase [Lacihabitans sp. CCS-44]|uniref:N-acetylmuramoyl-L-alanine amidase family protein n=1 Tax=Lacihabitans sp. CCS-44 TaxID=2487331 RepID=UPI0020CCF9A5|nr:N-acetylmuramoyl-L-alanine amidase [Lacihabitans sp. CCS-44]MCP9756160.1 N-acetylmuramoyl-L-alanine amidase [Lacihabitans sp. CCS-44]
MKLINLKIALVWVFTAAIFLGFTSNINYNARGLKTVVLDAGHGGKDPGTGNGKEKKYALDITLKLGEKIEENFSNVKVIYTRDKDVFVPLHERAAIANKSKADLFISIHCNANPHSKSLRGTETYVMGLHKTQENLDLAKNENNVILYEENYKKSYKGYNPASPLAHIMLANYQNAFMNQSLEFAAKVEKNMGKVGHKSRGVKQAGFIVIWETTMPSVLVETGYLTNSEDSNLLASTSGREKVALAIFRAFEEYKNQIEK